MAESTPVEHTWPRPRLEAEYRDVLEALRFCLEWLKSAASHDPYTVAQGCPTATPASWTGGSTAAAARELAHLRRVARLPERE